MKIKEYLKLPEEEQSEIAGKLEKEPWKHNIVNNARGDYTGLADWCTKCETGPVYDDGTEKYPFKKTIADWVEKGCSVPTRTLIDWNHAKALQGECDGLAFQKAMTEVMRACKDDLENHHTDYFIAYIADPSHIFAALLLMKGILE